MKNVLIVALLVLLITGCTVDEPQAYDVVFDVDGGSSVLPQSILENETIKKPSDPKKEEFIFMYWYTENSSEPFDFTIQITSDITLHAKWREVLHYTISFETNGGTAINDVTAKEETLLDKPNDPEKDDYVFVRWYKDSELNTIFDFESDMVTQDITLYALWQEQALYDLYQTLSQDIDYEAMGFYYSFDIPISYTPWDYSENGSIDPFLGETIAYEEPGRTGDYSQIAPFWSYFDETNYNIYTRWDVSRNAWYYVDLKLVDDKWQLLFFPDGYEPYLSISHRPGPYIEGIESNGYYSYVINMIYSDSKGQQKLKYTYFRIFYAIYHDDDFPYFVFFNDTYMYLINKSHHFDQSILFDLVASDDLTFFK